MTHSQQKFGMFWQKTIAKERASYELNPQPKSHPTEDPQIAPLQDGDAKQLLSERSKPWDTPYLYKSAPCV